MTYSRQTLSNLSCKSAPLPPWTVGDGWLLCSDQVLATALCTRWKQIRMTVQATDQNSEVGRTDSVGALHVLTNNAYLTWSVEQRQEILPCRSHTPLRRRISLCTDLLMRKKNYGSTPNLDFNPLSTRFNYTEFLPTSMHWAIPFDVHTPHRWTVCPGGFSIFICPGGSALLHCMSRGNALLHCMSRGNALLHYMSRGSALLHYMSRGFLQWFRPCPMVPIICGTHTHVTVLSKGCIL